MFDLKLFKLLEEQYEYAIGLFNTQWKDLSSQNKMLIHLAEAFMTREDYSNIQKMIKQIFQIKDDQLRHNMIEFISQQAIIHREDDMNQTAERIKYLWNWRITELESENSFKNYSIELKAYGGLFELDCLPNDWALNQLHRTLLLQRDVRDWYEVCKKLSKLSVNFPVQTAKCIMLLSKSNNHWYLSRTSIVKNVISAIISSGDKDAIDIVDETINHLLARGFSGYDSLIEDR